MAELLAGIQHRDLILRGLRNISPDGAMGAVKAGVLETHSPLEEQPYAQANVLA